MENRFEGMSFRQFSEELASSASVPGGGAAAALAGALGVALGHMVGALTVGKPRYAANEPAVKEAMEQAEQVRLRMLELIEADANAFAPMSAVFKMPKDTDAEKAARQAAMDAAMKVATQPQLELMDACLDALRLLALFMEKGSRIMVSDAAAGAALCRGAIEAAYVNVYVNLASITDLAYTGDTEAKAQQMLDAGNRMADLIVGRSLELIRMPG